MIDSQTLWFYSGKLIIGALLFIRITGMMAGAPLFRSEAIPVQLKILLSVILAFSLSTAFWQEKVVIEFHLWNVILLVFKEFMVGLALGFAANTVFWAIRFAGGLIDFDMGYQTSMLFNIEETSPTIVGELKFMSILVVFLFINGHHYLLEGIWASVRAVPVGSFEVTESTVKLLIRIAVSVFVIALKISAPVLIALFLTNLALALLARVAPQTNIFILSFQMKIVVGLIMLFTSFPIIVMVSKYALQGLEYELMRFLLSLNPARV